MNSWVCFLASECVFWLHSQSVKSGNEHWWAPTVTVHTPSSLQAVLAEDRGLSYRDTLPLVLWNTCLLLLWLSLPDAYKHSESHFGEFLSVWVSLTFFITLRLCISAGIHRMLICVFISGQPRSSYNFYLYHGLANFDELIKGMFWRL